ncbi:MAG: lamin tail domain-containing protein [Pseudomonadota bacterium]
MSRTWLIAFILLASCGADEQPPSPQETGHFALEACGTVEDCTDDGDPCTETVCAAGECRHLRTSMDCCTVDNDCVPMNSCLDAQCLLEGEAETGTCVSVADPNKPGCCSTAMDCPQAPAGLINLCGVQDDALYKTCESIPDPDLCVAPPDATVVINEFMNNPEGNDDTTGEWIELFNASLAPVNVNGWSLWDEGADGHIIQGTSLVIPPGGYLLLARSNNPQANGGLAPDYVYYNFILSNGADEIILKNTQGLEMDRVQYGGTYTMTPGASMELASPYLDNNTPTHWFPASLPWGAGVDKGTPGEPNTDGFFLYFTSPVCDDDNPCSLDSCGKSGNPLCRHETIFDCCLYPVDCNDSDPCTLDICQPQTLTCVHQPLAGCCNLDTQCNDGSPCTLDTCSNHACRNTISLEMPGCCIADADCMDVNPCTIDFCKQEPSDFYKTCHHTSPGGTQCCLANPDCVDELPETIDSCVDFECQHLVDPEYCLAGPPQYCDDGDPCSVDACNLFAHLCTHSPMPDCCKANNECSDENLCTQDICQLGPHVCTHEWIPWCCLVAQDCVPYMTDIDTCKVPACIDHECRLLHIPQEDCCIVDEDCDDGDACTEDICNPGNSNCSHIPKGKGCCNTVADCLEDDDPCTHVKCISDECIYQATTGCCMGDWQCEDVNFCTADLCLDYECRFMPGSLEGCCVADWDCPTPDGACQESWCSDEGYCEIDVMDPCVLSLNRWESFNRPLPLVATGWSPTGPLAGAWSALSGGGPLGPDRRQGLSFVAELGSSEGCLMSPVFASHPVGPVSVTWEQWIEVLPAAVPGALRLDAWPAGLPGEVETAWSMPLAAIENRKTPWMAGLPQKITTGNFRIAFCAVVPQGNELALWALDNVLVGTGSPPRILDHPAPLLLQPGEDALVQVLVKDTDSKHPLFVGLAGPLHATLDSVSPLPGGEHTRVRVRLHPSTESDLGEWKVRLTITDGFFYDRVSLMETVYVALCNSASECDDVNSCSDDWCDPVLGCQHEFAAGCCNELTPCDDGDECTVDECQDGQCGYGALDCDDGNICTNDVCDPSAGCLHPYNTLSCSDGSVCTKHDKCSLGACEGLALDCNDGLECTLDTCDPLEGCENKPICSDGFLCTTDVCTPLGCFSGKAPVGTPLLDGNLWEDWQEDSLAATKADPVQPIHFYTEVDQGNLYLALDMVPVEGEALLIFIDTDFGAGTGFAELATIPTMTEQALDLALAVDLTANLPGFAADVVIGTVAGAQVIGFGAEDAGARRLLLTGAEAMAGTVLANVEAGQMEMALTWQDLLPGEPLVNQVMALLVVAVDLETGASPWQIPYSTFGGLTNVVFVGIPDPSCLLPFCGDAVLDQGEACDDGDLNSDETPDACRSGCALPSCGDGVTDTGEECDDGLLNSDAFPNTCRLTCILPWCGDGLIDDGEACDDGALNSDEAADACRTDCALPGCGDGVQDEGEDCDDGNNVDFDGGCQGDCTLYVVICGDGIQDGSEECDDGELNSDALPDACRTDCDLASCGDNVIDTGETCDDGNLIGGDACGLDCQPYAPGCGNGWPDDGEECDGGDLNSDETPDACRTDCTLPSCGDDVQDGDEDCDDGDLNSDEVPDACRLNCTLPWCGDDVQDSDEDCDDGALFNILAPDACRPDCTLPWCGDGIHDPGYDEACDTGEDNADDVPNACRTDCALPSCGDSVTDGSEECDDGNQALEDGCTPACMIEVYIPDPGDVIITEIMQNPDAVYDTLGEYIEVYNTRDYPIDINGWEIQDEGADYHMIDNGGPLWIGSGAYMVLALSDDPVQNGGFVADYQYASSILLGNGSDEVILSSKGAVSDAVAYDGGPDFPDPKGASMNLDPDAFNEVDNDDGANWCETSLASVMTSGDYGTPGEPNEQCP